MDLNGNNPMKKGLKEFMFLMHYDLTDEEATEYCQKNHSFLSSGYNDCMSECTGYQGITRECCEAAWECD